MRRHLSDSNAYINNCSLQLKFIASKYVMLDMATTQYFSIPDVLITWPWKRMINPMLAEVNDETDAWLMSLAVLEPAQLQKFYTYKFSTYSIHLVSFSCHERLIKVS